MFADTPGIRASWVAIFGEAMEKSRRGKVEHTRNSNGFSAFLSLSVLTVFFSWRIDIPLEGGGSHCYAMMAIFTKRKTKTSCIQHEI